MITVKLASCHFPNAFVIVVDMLIIKSRGLYIEGFPLRVPPNSIVKLVSGHRCTTDGFPRLLPLLTESARNKSAAIRRRCLDYAMLALARWGDAAFERHLTQTRYNCPSLVRL